MLIKKIKIENFRAIKTCEFFPAKHNVLLGPNNSGKTAVLEAINCLLNPEFSFRSGSIDENDFYNRDYLSKKTSHPPTTEASQPDATTETSQTTSSEAPRILVEAVLGPIEHPEDLLLFRGNLVSWDPSTQEVIDSTEEEIDPISTDKEIAIRIVFEALYDAKEDEFIWRTYFKPHSSIRWDPEDETSCVPIKKEHKLRIGFLIYRDFRALQRPITLDPSGLLMRVFESQDAKPTNFEESFDKTANSLSPLTTGSKFGTILNDIKNEFQSYLPLSKDLSASLDIELTDRTRTQFKANAQLYVNGTTRLPIHKFGAGTRSLATLGLLTYIMRKRKRGIIALEEPETFLFPHAQRRVVTESMGLATQVFVTTHSPYVLEQFQVEQISRVDLTKEGVATVTRLDPSLADPKFYKRNLRKQLAEALLSRAVIVFEEDSITKWILLLAEKLSQKTIDGVKIEPLDLVGIAAISADSNGSVVPIASFVEAAGLPVLICIDNTSNVPAITAWCAQNKPHVMLKQNGIEQMLIEELSADLLKKFVTAPVDATSPAIPVATYDSLSPEEQKKKALEYLKNNKGSIPYHEWMAGQMDETNAPASLLGILTKTFKLLKLPTATLAADDSTPLAPSETG